MTEFIIETTFLSWTYKRDQIHSGGEKKTIFILKPQVVTTEQEGKPNLKTPEPNLHISNR